MFNRGLCLCYIFRKDIRNATKAHRALYKCNSRESAFVELGLGWDLNPDPTAFF
jgi:hypothetical protein